MPIERDRELLAHAKRKQIFWQRIMDDTSYARWWRATAAKNFCRYTRHVNALVAKLA